MAERVEGLEMHLRVAEVVRRARRSPPWLLRSLGAAFAARRLRWYVFGAQAVIAYGRQRLTADVDVAADLAGARVGEQATTTKLLARLTPLLRASR